MKLEIFTLVFLLIIALELAWIVRKGVNSVSQSRKNLSDAMQALTKAQEHLIEITRNLTAALPIKTRESQTSDKTALSQREDYVTQLLAALDVLSDSIANLRLSVAQSTADVTNRVAAFAEKFEQAWLSTNTSLRSARTELIEDRQQFLTALANQGNSQREELRGLMTALLGALQPGQPAVPESLRSNSHLKRSPSAPPIADDRTAAEISTASLSPLVTVQSSANSNSPSDSANSADRASQNAPPPTQASMEFAKLHNWVTANLFQIMNRSLGQWNKPEELFRDAPAELRCTVRLLDPDSKLVLARAGDTSRCLALALPGGYLDPRYYEWFSLPKGIGARVERTIRPAVVETNDTGYRVLERGSITQD